MGEKGKRKGEKGGKGGEERPKNSARPSRTHNNNTLSSAHATAGTLQGRRRTRHTHTSFFFFFLLVLGEREIFFFFSGRSFIFMWFDSAHSPARARAFIEFPPNFFFFSRIGLGRQTAFPVFFLFSSYYYYYLFTKHILLLSLFFFFRFCCLASSSRSTLSLSHNPLPPIRLVRPFFS